jgi:hypothetical protein
MVLSWSDNQRAEMIALFGGTEYGIGATFSDVQVAVQLLLNEFNEGVAVADPQYLMMHQMQRQFSRWKRGGHLNNCQKTKRCYMHAQGN